MPARFEAHTPYTPLQFDYIEEARHETYSSAVQALSLAHRALSLAHKMGRHLLNLHVRRNFQHHRRMLIHDRVNLPGFRRSHFCGSASAMDSEFLRLCYSAPLHLVFELRRPPERLADGFHSFIVCWSIDGKYSFGYLVLQPGGLLFALLNREQLCADLTVAAQYDCLKNKEEKGKVHHAYLRRKKFDRDWY